MEFTAVYNYLGSSMLRLSRRLLGRHRQCHYDLLGVARTSSSEEIKAAFERRVKGCYHDSWPELYSPFERVKHFQLVADAYDILGDEEKRRAYDKTFSDESKKGNQFTAVVCGSLLSFGAMLAKGPPAEKASDRAAARGHGIEGKWNIATETHEEINWLDRQKNKVLYTPRRTFNKSTGRMSQGVMVTATCPASMYETRYFHLEREDQKFSLGDQTDQPYRVPDWNEL